MDRLIVPGNQARQLAATAAGAWEVPGHAAPVFYLHANTPDQFAFDAPLEDLARQENIPTAVLAAKRVEYRPGTVQTAGARWPFGWTLFPLLVGAAGLAGTWVVRRRWQRRTALRSGGAALQAPA
jgi:hypothetical protein